MPPDLIKTSLIIVWLSIAAVTASTYRDTRAWGVASAALSLVTAALHYLVYPYVIAPGITGITSLLLVVIGLRKSGKM